MFVCLQVRMAKVKQVGLLAAGCQPWNKDVCAASGDRFAYCATLAIYIYQVNSVCVRVFVRVVNVYNLKCIIYTAGAAPGKCGVTDKI